MSTYHEVHYGMFHKILPGLLFTREDFRGEVLSASRSGQLHTTLARLWDRVAERAIVEFGGDDGLLDIGPRSFSAEARSDSDGRVALVIGTPKVQGRVQASAVVALFSNLSPNADLRYFTCEAPMSPGHPWMVGEWKADGSRHNLGEITDPTTGGLLQFVCKVTGFEAAVERRPSRVRHANTAVRELPDIDEWLRDRGDKNSAFPTVNATPSSLGGGKARIGEPSAPIAHDPHGSLIPVVAGRITFSTSWASGPPELASDALTNLYRLLNAGGSALVMTTKKTKGLARRTSSYVQFMWNDDRSLVVEIQGDYSYWGASVPSSSWPQMERCGLSTPTGGVGNFGRVISADASHDERLQVLTDVFGAFISTLQPTGKIIPSIVGV